MVFLARFRKGKEVCGPTVNVLHCEHYRGLYSPKDVGICTVSDRDIAKKAQPTTVAELRRVLKLVPGILAEVANSQTGH
jgi:hypothetical protein